MGLWLLKPRDDLSEDDNPWVPWYNKVFGFIIRAEIPGEARAMADRGAGSETDEAGGDPLAWFDPRVSTCTELTPEGRTEVILRDKRSA